MPPVDVSPASPRPGGLRPTPPLALACLAGVALSLATTLRIVPALGSPDWLRGPLYDDAYYYLVIARNVAGGAGVTFDGAPVNGFQPLYLLPCVAIGALARWDMLLTPALVTAFNWLLYVVGGTWLLLGLWRRVAARPSSDAGAAFAVGLWLTHAYGARAALNGMETTLTMLVWLGAARVLLPRWDRPLTTRDGVIAGAALGLAFLVRNDTLVLTGVFGGGALLTAVRSPTADRNATLRALVVAAAVWLACATPWLAFNLVRFGSPLPQSGSAEGIGSFLDKGRWQQLVGVVGAFDRQVLAFPVPIGNPAFPAALQAAMGLGALAACAVLAAAAWRLGTPALRVTLSRLGVSVVLLAVVYAGLFGAPWNALRWLAPVTLVSVLVLATLLDAAWSTGRSGPRAMALGALALVLAGRLVTADQDARNACLTGTWPLLRQVQMLRPRGVIGSFQGGLLAWALPGRVTNLDGKVNHAALVALRSRRFPEYLRRSRVDFMLDSAVNMSGYDNDPAILAVFDRERTPDGIVLLRRRVRDRAAGDPR